MEYLKIANLIDGASNQPSKFRKKTWVEINNEHIMLLAKSNLKLQRYSLAYVIIVVLISLVKEK